MKNLDRRMPTPVALSIIAIACLLAATLLSAKAANTLLITEDGPNILEFASPLEPGSDYEFDIIGHQEGETYGLAILIEFDDLQAWTPADYWRTRFTPTSSAVQHAKIRNKEANVEDFVFLAAAVETDSWQLQGQRLIEITDDPLLAGHEGQAFTLGSNNSGSGDFGWLAHDPTNIPEPKAAVLFAIAMGMLFIPRRRKQCRRKRSQSATMAG